MIFTSEVEKLSTELKESNNKLSLLQKDLASVSNELLSQKSLNVDLSEKLELEKQAVLNLENQLREYETQIEMKRTEQEE